MKEIVIIAAMSQNGVIGINGKLPWSLSEDLKRFKKLTLENTVVMGRKTFESIGYPLPQRENIILTRQNNYNPREVLTARSLEEAINISTKDKIFIIGGSEVYDKAIPIADKMEITEVYGNYIGDRFFPDIDYSEWSLKSKINSDNCKFFSYERIK